MPEDHGCKQKSAEIQGYTSKWGQAPRGLGASPQFEPALLHPELEDEEPELEAYRYASVPNLRVSRETMVGIGQGAGPC